MRKRSYAAHQQKDEQNDHDQSQAATRAVTPSLAVRPRGNYTDQREHEDDQNNRSYRLMRLLPSASNLPAQRTAAMKQDRCGDCLLKLGAGSVRSRTLTRNRFGLTCDLTMKPLSQARAAIGQPTPRELVLSGFWTALGIGAFDRQLEALTVRRMRRKRES